MYVSDIVGNNKYWPAACLNTCPGMTAQIGKPDISAMRHSILSHKRMYLMCTIAPRYILSRIKSQPCPVFRFLSSVLTAQYNHLRMGKK